MVSKYRYKNITWIDLVSPTPTEILDLKDEFDIPELVADELGTCTLRSKVDFYEKQKLAYLVMHFPDCDLSNEHVEHEYDFVITKDLLITTRYEKIAGPGRLSNTFSTESFFEKAHPVESSGHLFVHIVKELYKNSLDELEDINDSLKEIEKNIFSGKQSKMVEEISKTNRRFVNFKQVLRHHEEILNSFRDIGAEIFGNYFKHNLTLLKSEYNRVRNTLEIGREILSDLRITNDSILNTKTNQTVKTLTSISFTLLPITFLTGVFGMNAPDHVLLIKDDKDMLFVLLLMAFIWIGLFIYFRSKKWI